MALDVNTALTTVEDVRIKLGLASPLTADQTALIEKAIKTTSAAALAFLGRPEGIGFVSGVVEKVKGYGTSPRLRVERTPIFSVTSITFPLDDVLDPATYEVEKSGRTGLIALKTGVLGVNGFAIGWGLGGAAVPFTGVLSAGIVGEPLADSEGAELVVIYSGGWKLPGQTIPPLPANVVELPADIQGAIEDACVGFFYRTINGRDPDVVSEKLMSEATTYVDRTKLIGQGSLIGWPAEAAAALQPYVRLAQF